MVRRSPRIVRVSSKVGKFEACLKPLLGGLSGPDPQRIPFNGRMASAQKQRAAVVVAYHLVR